jgi:hypothetical protein
VTAHTADILDEIGVERRAQDDKWGEQNHPDVPTYGGRPAIPTAAAARAWVESQVVTGRLSWLDILVEELAEAVEAIDAGDTDATRAELVQVAAVVAAWVECIDRRAAAR